MYVIVTIDPAMAWEAIPVRAIPFATGWVLSPDVLAKDLAHASELPRLHEPRSFCLTDDGESRIMYPKEWDIVIADLKSLSSELAATGKSREERYPIWYRESIARLPAGTFMYREEFALAFKSGYGRHRWGIRDEREGDREWTSHPVISEDLRAVVMEGFGRYKGPQPAAPGQATHPFETPQSPGDPDPAQERARRTQADTTAITRKSIKVPVRQDDLARELLEILKAMVQSGASPTPAAVMDELKRRKDSVGSCIEEAGDAWVTWSSSQTNKTKVLDMEALGARIDRMLDD